MNLFECQLDSDPFDDSSPPTATVAPVAADFSDVATAIDSVADGTVIRIVGGTHNVNYFTFDPRQVMLQGGWSPGFLTRDLKAFPTTLDGQHQGDVFFMAADSDKAVVILDGLRLTRSFGAVTLISEGTNCFISSIYNCVIDQVAPASSFAGSLHQFNWDSSISDRTVANTIIADNEESGIYSQHTDTSVARWRIINTTITDNHPGIDPGDNGQGFDAFTLDTGSLEVTAINTIIWGNTLPDVEISGDVVFNIDFSDVGVVVTNRGATYNPGTNVVDVNPDFEDVEGGDFHLGESSPLIDAGTNEGTPPIDYEGDDRFIGSTVDIGADEWNRHTEEWQEAYRFLFTAQSDLRRMRAFRDQVLVRSARGKLYTDWLYSLSEASLAVLLKHPELMQRASKLLRVNKTAVARVLAGKPGTLRHVDEIAEFLDAYGSKSPVTLRLLAQCVKFDLLNARREARPFLGFQLENGRSGIQLSSTDGAVSVPSAP